MRPKRIIAFYTWWAIRVLPSRIRPRVDDLFERFLEGLSSLSNPNDVVMIFATSVLIWLLETVKYWFVMHAFPFEVSFLVLMLMNGLVNLATTLPSAPGYIGTFDTPGIETLAAFGVNRDLAASYTFTLHAALWLPVTIVGAYFFWRRHSALVRFLGVESAGGGTTGAVAGGCALRVWVGDRDGVHSGRVPSFRRRSGLVCSGNRSWRGHKSLVGVCSMKNIAVAGTGYVGLSTGTCFADLGNTVTCIDISAEKIEMLLAGQVPIYEPGLGEMIERNVKAGRLRFTTDYAEALAEADFVFICVGTPSGVDGEADLRYVRMAAESIAETMNHPLIIVNKSTVPVGTGDWVADIVSRSLPSPIEFDVVSCPEFMREGSAIYDFMNPDRVVLGSKSEEAAREGGATASSATYADRADGSANG